MSACQRHQNEFIAGLHQNSQRNFNVWQGVKALMSTVLFSHFVIASLAFGRVTRLVSIKIQKISIYLAFDLSFWIFEGNAGKATEKI